MRSAPDERTRLPAQRASSIRSAMVCGCGNLRARRFFIGHMDFGNYYGIDMTPAMLLSAQRVIVEDGLYDKARLEYPVCHEDFHNKSGQNGPVISPDGTLATLWGEG